MRDDLAQATDGLKSVGASGAVQRLVDATAVLSHLSWTANDAPTEGIEELDRDQASCVTEALMAVAEHDIVSDHLATAMMHDFGAWLDKPSQPPTFDRSVAALGMPGPGKSMVFFGPVRTPNSTDPAHWRFETVYGRQVDAAEEDRLWAAVDDSVTRSVQLIELLNGSTGFTRGNCMVLFPENVLKTVPTRRQHFAFVFPNKFPAVFRTAIPSVRAAILGSATLATDAKNSLDLFRLRCQAAVVHERYHQLSVFPLGQNVRLKNSTVTAVLDEVRVDCLAAVFAAERIDRAVAEVLLLDRVLRAPFQSDWRRNPDSGAGLLLLEYLFRSGLIGAHWSRHDDWLTSWLCAAAELGNSLSAAEGACFGDPQRWVRTAQTVVGEFLPLREAERGSYGQPSCLADLGLADHEHQPTMFDESTLIEPLLTASTSQSKEPGYASGWANHD